MIQEEVKVQMTHEDTASSIKFLYGYLSFIQVIYMVMERWGKKSAFEKVPEEQVRITQRTCGVGPIHNEDGG